MLRVVRHEGHVHAHLEGLAQRHLHLDAQRGVVVAQHGEVVAPWEGQLPVVAECLAVAGVVGAVQTDHGPGDGRADGAVHEPVDAVVHLLDELQQGLAVLLPVPGQLGGHGELVAAHLDGELQAAGPHVVPVLHAPGDAVPLRPVGDALGEVLVLEELAGLAQVHGGVGLGVDRGQVSEQGVVLGGVGLAPADARVAQPHERVVEVVLVVVVRVVGHQGAAVEVGGEHERQRQGPVHQGGHLGLRHLVEPVRAVLVREVPVQIDAVRIGPAHAAGAIALPGHLVAVGVHAVEEVHPGAVHHLGHAVVVAVALQQVLGEQQQHLLAHHLVAVHVGHVLELGHAGHMGSRRGEDLEHPQVAALDALADAVEAGQRGVAGGDVAQEAGRAGESGIKSFLLKFQEKTSHTLGLSSSRSCSPLHGREVVVLELGVGEEAIELLLALLRRLRALHLDLPEVACRKWENG